MHVKRGAYQGVILAAGHGSRMGPFGARMPKPIVPICNKPLLAYQLEHMRAVGVEEVTIVIGHLGHLITQTIGDGSAFGVKVSYVEQEKRLGIAHALGQLEPHLDRPFLLFLGDIYFEIAGLEPMLAAFETEGTAAVLAVKEEPDPEAIRKNFSVLLEEDGSVRRVVEKPRHVTNRLKGCGLYLFDLAIFDAIRRTPRTALRDEYELTDSIQILIDYEYTVRVSPIVNWDMNITVVDDLLVCCEHELRKLGQSALIGEGAQVSGGAELVDTVIGNRAVVASGARFERCVLLDGVQVSGGPYKDRVFTEDHLAE